MITRGGDGAPRGDHAATRRRLALVTLGCASLYALPTILNGVPFVYIDSATYLAQGQEALRAFAPALVPADAPVMPSALDAPAPLAEAGDEVQTGADEALPVVVGGRSVYYGLLAYLAYAFSGGWALVALQSAAAAWPLVLLARGAVPAGWPLAALLLAGVTAFGTAAGVFTGMMMPDAWAAVVILSVAALAAGRPSLLEGLSLLGLVALGVVFHKSHLLLLALLAGLVLLSCLPFVAGHLGGPVRARRLALAGMGACLLVGVAAQAAFSSVVERRYGAAPISRPHLSARLIDSGPGLDVLERSCAPGGGGEDLALCAYRDRLPLRWTRFLFEPDPSVGVFTPAPAAVKRALSEQDGRFALMTLRAEPVRTTSALARDAGRQLARFGVQKVPTTARRSPDTIDRLPPALGEDVRTALVSVRPGVLPVLDRVQAVLVVGSAAAFTLGLVLASARGRTPPGLLLALAVLVVGTALNAVICGALASPYPRFQARVAWLFVIATLARSVHDRPSEETSP